jgi:hypothetical protein
MVHWICCSYRITYSIHSQKTCYSSSILHMYPLERYANCIISFISHPLLLILDLSRLTTWKAHHSYYVFHNFCPLERCVFHIVAFTSAIHWRSCYSNYVFTSNGKMSHFSWVTHMNSVIYLPGWLTAILNVLSFTWCKTLFKASSVALPVLLLNLWSWRIGLVECTLLHLTSTARRDDNTDITDNF